MLAAVTVVLSILLFTPYFTDFGLKDTETQLIVYDDVLYLRVLFSHFSIHFQNLVAKFRLLSRFVFSFDSLLIGTNLGLSQTATLTLQAGFAIRRKRGLARQLHSLEVTLFAKCMRHLIMGTTLFAYPDRFTIDVLLATSMTVATRVRSSARLMIPKTSFSQV